MPDHVHILTEGIHPTADAFEFVRRFKQLTAKNAAGVAGIQRLPSQSLVEGPAYRSRPVHLVESSSQKPMRVAVGLSISGSPTRTWTQESHVRPAWCAPWHQKSTEKSTGLETRHYKIGCPVVLHVHTSLSFTSFCSFLSHSAVLLSFFQSMSHSKNPRLYFALLLLLVSAAIIIFSEHRPSFLRPNLHMYAYVTTDDGSVTVLDLAKLQAVSKIPVGPAISDLREHTKRNEIWGVSSAGGYVFVLDTPTNQITRIPVGPSPYSVDFSSDGNRIYTTTAASDQLVAIDAASRQVLGRAHTAAEPVQAHLTPDGKNIAVVNRRAGMLSIHDARTLQLLNSIPVIPQPDEVLITPDSALAFVMSRTQTRLSVVDLDRAVLLTNLELAGKPTQMLLKPDGGELYVISPEAHGLQAVNTWTHEMGDSMLLGSAPAFAIISADASEMYVSDRSASRVIPVDILNRHMLAPPIFVGASPSFMRFSPTDRGAKSPMLLVANESSGDVAIIRTRTYSLITLIPAGPHPTRIAVKTF